MWTKFADRMIQTAGLDQQAAVVSGFSAGTVSVLEMSLGWALAHALSAKASLAGPRGILGDS